MVDLNANVPILGQPKGKQAELPTVNLIVAAGCVAEVLNTRAVQGEYRDKDILMTTFATLLDVLGDTPVPEGMVTIIEKAVEMASGAGQHLWQMEKEAQLVQFKADPPPSEGGTNEE